MRPFNDTQVTGYGGNNAFHTFPQSRVHNPHSRPDFKKRYPSPRIPISINRSKLSIPFKSQMCLLFSRGRCYHGENCHFSHSQSAIRNPGPAISRQCSNFTSDGVECKVLDDFDLVCKKNYLCKQWLRFGNCSYGDRCIFAHGKAGLQYTPKNELASQPNNEPSSHIGINIAATANKHRRCFLKWDVEKMSGIYADWIDDGHNLHCR